MAIGFVQKQTGRGGGVNSFALTFGTNPTAGRFLNANYSVWLSGGGIPNATPTGGGTWSTTTAPTERGSANAFLNYCESASGGATTVTVDYGTGFYIVGSITEFSGLVTSSSIDQQTSNSNALSTTPSSGTTGTLSQADELVIAVLSLPGIDTDASIDVPATTGYTNIHVEQDAQNFMGHSSDYKIVAATTAVSAAWGTTDNAPWSAKIATFKAAGGAFTLTADPGSYTITGTAASLLFGRKLVADAGSYSVTGTAAALLRAGLLSADAGVYAISGSDATLTYSGAGNKVLTADPGVYTVTGTDASLLADRLLTAGEGTYAITGQVAQALFGRLLAAEAGSYVITGTDAAFLRTYVLTAESGTYSVNGQTVNLTYSASPVVPGGFVIHLRRRRRV